MNTFLPSLLKARGSHEAVVTCTDTMGYMDTAIVSVHQQDLGESLQSEAKGEDVFYVSEAGLQLKSVTKETKGSLDINVQDENFTLFGVNFRNC